MSSMFNATCKANVVGDGTVGATIAWLEKFINVLFPDNGIEYWSDNQYGTGSRYLKRGDLVPGAGCTDGCVHHVACYVRQGNCEGRIIEVALSLRDGQFKSLTWMKTFGKEDECWQIARAIDEALNSIIFWEEVPELVSMSEKVPRQQNWHRQTSLAEEVTILSGTDKVLVDESDIYVGFPLGIGDREGPFDDLVAAELLDQADQHLAIAGKRVADRVGVDDRHDFPVPHGFIGLEDVSGTVGKRWVEDDVGVDCGVAKLEEIKADHLVALIAQGGVLGDVDLAAVDDRSRTTVVALVLPGSGIGQVAVTGGRFQDAGKVLVLEQRPGALGQFLRRRVKLQIIHSGLSVVFVRYQRCYAGDIAVSGISI